MSTTTPFADKNTFVNLSLDVQNSFAFPQQMAKLKQIVAECSHKFENTSDWDGFDVFISETLDLQSYKPVEVNLIFRVELAYVKTLSRALPDLEFILTLKDLYTDEAVHSFIIKNGLSDTFLGA